MPKLSTTAAPVASAASVVTSKFTANYAARLVAIRAMGVNEPEKLEELAKELGIEKPKGAAGKSWKVNAPEVTEQIAQAEFRANDESIYLPGLSPEEIAEKQPSIGIGRYTGKPTKPEYPTSTYLKAGVRIGSNGDKVRTGINGEVVNS